MGSELLKLVPGLLWTSLHVLSPVADFALYPSAVINHSHKCDYMLMYWRRKWQPAPVFLPGESQGRWSLVGCCLWGRTELDTTEAT